MDASEGAAERRAAADDLVKLSEELGLYPEHVPAAADMRYDGEDTATVTRVFVRVEWAGGKIREYEAVEPQDFTMNDPETDVSLVPMKMAVQGHGSPVVPMMAAVPSLRLSFTAHPRHNMHIRAEVRVIRGGPGDSPVQPLPGELLRRDAGAHVEDDHRTVRLGKDAITGGGDGEGDRGTASGEPGVDLTEETPGLG